MCLLADRTERHGSGREASRDGLNRLDFIDRHGGAEWPRVQQPSQGGTLGLLVVDERGVFAEDRKLPRACRVLQLEDGLWREQTHLAVATPLIFATAVEFRPCHGRRSEGLSMPASGLFGHDGQRGTADRRRGAGEPRVDHGAVEAYGFKDLGTAIALQG